MNIENTVVEESGEQSAIRENKLELVERLADDLAHEIKNPLHSMVINLEVLRRRLARLDDAAREELLRYVGVLSAEVERVNRRVDLLLRLLRPNHEPDEVTTLPEVIEELRELLDLECERHEVTFEMELPPGLLGTRLPRAATRQMILSLVLKTLDSLAPGSCLLVRPEIDDGSIRLHFEGRVAAAPERAKAPELADHAYLQVAHALAHRLGAELTVAPPGAESGLLDVATDGFFVLSIPRR